MKFTGHDYESPSVRLSGLELCGFLCSSGNKVQVDRWDSEDGGVIDMDDDVLVTP